MIFQPETRNYRNRKKRVGSGMGQPDGSRVIPGLLKQPLCWAAGIGPFSRSFSLQRFKLHLSGRFVRNGPNEPGPCFSSSSLFGDCCSINTKVETLAFSTCVASELLHRLSPSLSTSQSQSIPLHQSLSIVIAIFISFSPCLISARRT